MIRLADFLTLRWMSAAEYRALIVALVVAALILAYASSAEPVAPLSTVVRG